MTVTAQTRTANEERLPPRSTWYFSNWSVAVGYPISRNFIRSKPPRGKGMDAKIVFDGKSLTFDNGFNSDKEIRQITAEADYIQNLLTALLATLPAAACTFTDSRPMPIRPLLVYPGWYIDYSKAKGASVRVINDTMLVDHINNSTRTLAVSTPSP